MAGQSRDWSSARRSASGSGFTPRIARPPSTQSKPCASSKPNRALRRPVEKTHISARGRAGSKLVQKARNLRCFALTCATLLLSSAFSLATAVPASQESPAGTASSVLLVEEYDALAAAITSALKKFAPRHRARAVESLAEAEALAEIQPQLFIVDFDPPRFGTLEFLRASQPHQPERALSRHCLRRIPGIAFRTIWAKRDSLYRKTFRTG